MGIGRNYIAPSYAGGSDTTKITAIKICRYFNKNILINQILLRFK